MLLVSYKNISLGKGANKTDRQIARNTLAIVPPDLDGVCWGKGNSQDQHGQKRVKSQDPSSAVKMSNGAAYVSPQNCSKEPRNQGTKQQKRLESLPYSLFPSLIIINISSIW
jgi:hypothetical protein